MNLPLCWMQVVSQLQQHVRFFVNCFLQLQNKPATYKRAIINIQLLKKRRRVMSRVLVIGCGGVASVAIQKCCQADEVFTELCIASRTKENVMHLQKS